MKVIKIPFDQIDQFSTRDKDYQLNPEIFKDFIEDLPTLSSFAHKIEQRKSIAVDRELLTQHLANSYEHLPSNDKCLAQIEKLKSPNTFTVSTAHQLSLLGGPLYYILKILSTIHLSEKLNQTYPNHHFVPVLVHGAEDHDFEEINHLSLFNQTITWESEQQGSTGRMTLEGIDEPINQLYDKLKNTSHFNHIQEIIDQAKSKSDTYGTFMFRFVHSLFSSFGLIQLNMDNSAFKAAFRTILKKEITSQFSNELVGQSIDTLENLGYKAQASPREINLFYLVEQGRHRIVEENGSFTVLDIDKHFDKDQILSEIDLFPERFSPNVILRPLYQELILPNLAYVGGGGELAYWLERKRQFEEAGISYPLLIRRNSAGILKSQKLDQWLELGLSEEELTLPFDRLVTLYLERHEAIPLDVKDYAQQIQQVFAALESAISQLDPTLGKLTKAESAKATNSLQNIEGKLKKLYKQRETVSLNRIKKIQQVLFPDGSLQERKTNFMEFYATNGDALLTALLPHLNPLEKEFNIFIID